MFIDESNTVPFDTIDLGHMFFAHEQLWVRTTTSGGKCLPAANEVNYGVCNFMMEGDRENEPETVTPINTEELIEFLKDSIDYQQMENEMK